MCRPVVHCWPARNGSKIADAESSVIADSHVDGAAVVSSRLINASETGVLMWRSAYGVA